MTLLFILFSFITGFAGGIFFAGIRFQPQPLTEDQVNSLWNQYANGKDFEATVRAVEKAHGIY